MAERFINATALQRIPEDHIATRIIRTRLERAPVLAGDPPPRLLDAVASSTSDCVVVIELLIERLVAEHKQC